MSNLSWRGYTLAGNDGESWSTEYEAGYLGVSFDEVEPPAWSAVIECGQLTGEGDGPDAATALESALADLHGGVDDHVALLREHFKGP